MDAAVTSVLEDEIEKLDILIKAAEKWGNGYKKDRVTHAKIIKIEAKMARIIRKLFREKAQIVGDYVDWNVYNDQVQAAFSIKTIVSGDFYDGLSSDFVSILFDSLAIGITTGAVAGENIYKIPLGIRSTDAAIQQLTTERLAWLVGKRVDKSGRIVNNPNSTYSITDKIREDIAKSIQTSISLGENKALATDRITKIVNDPARADRIAQTETVNAYSAGIKEFGVQSGATGKEWQDIGATDVCGEYADMGVVPIDFLYGGDTDGPAAHTGCRCNLRLAYANEYQG